MLGDFQTVDNLLISIDRDRNIQKAFSGLTGSPKIAMAGIGAGESGWVCSDAIDPLAPVKKHLHKPVEKPGKCYRLDQLTEFVKRREMMTLIERDPLAK